MLSGQDVLALLPTGGGKSICYQVPALAREGLCLVISPLIALMHDQVKNLRSRGIKADAITSGMSRKQIDILLDNAIYGNTKLLYVSPERLQTKLFQARFEKMNVNLIAVDEAHCISQWGYDFRPAYLEIAQLRKTKPQVKFIALTATATEKVVHDICDKLVLNNPDIIRKSFYRGNLSYSTHLVQNKKNRIAEYLKSHPGCGIIYCATRKGVKELASYLLSEQIRVDFYHAGLDFETRRKKQEEWLTEKTRVIICTNAFGMGIDKPNVRFVLHYDIPETIEAYFQEAGRAGRDEKPSEAILFYEEHDKSALIEKVNTKFPPLDLIRTIYNALGNHFQLAIGSGKDEKFPFEINDFCNKYGFQLMEAYNAFKFLESTGYLELTEGMNQPARLRITADQMSLYNQQVRDPEINTLVQFILRSHMGIFDDYVPINEFVIGQKTQMNKKKIIEKLNYLQKLELADYVPQANEPHITWLTERLPPDHLLFSPRFYKERKEDAFEKMKAMIHYLESDKCRSVELLHYFGEVETQDCGTCNICLEKVQKSAHVNLYASMNDFIQSALQIQEQIKTRDLLEKFHQYNRDEILSTLRMLIDNGLVKPDDRGEFLRKA